ncbi:MAG: sulfotransferase, partial [Acidimicrobiales bacterium]
MTMPDFIVMGAPKAGSTALHAALAGHPELFLSPVKEPKFFLCDNQPPP